MVGALLPLPTSRRQDFLLDRLARQQPGVLFLKWLVVAGVDYRDSGWGSGSRGLLSLFHQDWLRLQHERRGRRFHDGMLLRGESGLMLGHLPRLEQRGKLLSLFAGKAGEARLVTNPVIEPIIDRDVGDQRIIGPLAATEVIVAKAGSDHRDLYLVAHVF